MDFLEQNIKSQVAHEMEKDTDMIANTDRKDARLAIKVLFVAFLMGFFVRGCAPAEASEKFTKVFGLDNKDCKIVIVKGQCNRLGLEHAWDTWDSISKCVFYDPHKPVEAIMAHSCERECKNCHLRQMKTKPETENEGWYDI